MGFHPSIYFVFGFGILKIFGILKEGKTEIAET